jgi:hypothetical protein
MVWKMSQISRRKVVKKMTFWGEIFGGFRRRVFVKFNADSIQVYKVGEITTKAKYNLIET